MKLSAVLVHCCVYRVKSGGRNTLEVNTNQHCLTQIQLKSRVSGLVSGGVRIIFVVCELR